MVFKQEGWYPNRKDGIQTGSMVLTNRKDGISNRKDGIDKQEGWY
jgi:hypothetical protein